MKIQRISIHEARDYLDSFMLLFLLTYSFEILVSPIDGQMFIENPGYASGYGQLIDRSFGQVLLIGYFVVNFRDSLRAMKEMDVLLAILLFVSVISSLWSVRPIFTLYKAADLGLLFVGPIFFSFRIGFTRALAVFWYFCFSILAISLLLALLDSPYAIMGGYHAGLWRGLFAHKNHFGVFLVMFMILSLFSTRYLRISSGLRNAALFGIIASLAKSGSVAAFLMAPVAVVAGFLLLAASHNRLSRGSFVFLSVLYIAPAIFFLRYVFPDLVEKLGRDTSLSGRVELWMPALEAIQLRPWGYGYGTSGGIEVLENMRLYSGWIVAPSTHNGFITMLLDVGFLPTGIWVLWVISKIATVKIKSENGLGLGASQIGLSVLILMNGFVDSAGAAYLSALTLAMVFVIAQSKRQAADVG